MNLRGAEEGKEYIVKSIDVDDSRWAATVVSP